MKQILYSICSVALFLLLIRPFSFSQSGYKENIKVMFYNVENLFDVYNDPVKADQEFTPGGERRWNNSRYYSKINRISKAIIALGQWQPPDLIGLCEVENKKVLQDLVYETPLKRSGYKIVHSESNDRRGIDVAVLYRPVLLKLIGRRSLRIEFRDDTAYRSRDILYAKFLSFDVDTLHVFVNHWPSKYGGVLNTEPRRMDAATALRDQLDSLFRNSNDPAIIAMGDLNDGPGSDVLSYLLDSTFCDGSNMLPLLEKSNGTIKFRGNWLQYDHLLVSPVLADSLNGLYIPGMKGYVYADDFLMERDNRFPGFKPFRTFIGYRYNGGFSDHLPVYTIIKK